MRCSRMICAIVALTILGASRAPAGTLTLDFGIEFVSFITGTGSPATGSARVVLTGVDELGMITERSARGSLESFRAVRSFSDELGTTRFELRLEDPVSGILGLDDPASGDLDRIAFMFNPEVLIPNECVGSAALCAGNPDTVSLIGVSLSNVGMPGAVGIRVFFTGEPFIIGVATGTELARTFVPGTGEVPEPIEGAMLLFGLSAHAVRATWKRRTSVATSRLAVVPIQSSRG